MRVDTETEAIVPRPRTGETPIRHVRVSDERWTALQDIAESETVTPSALVNEGIDRVIAARKPKRSRPRRLSGDDPQPK